MDPLPPLCRPGLNICISEKIFPGRAWEEGRKEHILWGSEAADVYVSGAIELKRLTEEKKVEDAKREREREREPKCIPLGKFSGFFSIKRGNDVMEIR